MARRPLRPHFGSDGEQALLQTLRCATVAEELTGDRTHFHLKAHGGPR